jgi:RNA polymerase sigma-70 factor (ECF subfamily)
MLWDVDEAADATHDVFARALKRQEPFESRDHARAWLMTVARNRCTDILRGRGRLRHALDRVAPYGEVSADPEGLAVNRQVVTAVLGQLSARERRLLWQSAVERQPLAEIAAGLRLSYLATAQAVRRARRRAWSIAARIAAIIGLLRLRRLIPLTLPAQPALLLALIPFIAVSLPSAAQTQAASPNGFLSGPLGNRPVPSIIHASVAARVANSSGPSALETGTAAPSPLVSNPPLPTISGAMTTVKEVIAVHELDRNRLLQSLPQALSPSPLPSLSVPVPTATALPAH